MIDNQTVINKLYEAFPDSIIMTSESLGDLFVNVRREDIVEVARFLRDDPQLNYQFLENLCGVDYLGRTPRFEVVYHFLSFANRHRVCIKVGVPEDDLMVASLTGLWATANWQERETFDMFGIVFTNHPRLERILMPEDWEGYPQRKDVPLGAEEVAFTYNYDAINARKTFAQE